MINLYIPLYKTLLLSGFTIFIISSIPVIYAQSETAPLFEEEKEGIILADIKIGDIRVVSQTTDEIQVSFTLTNFASSPQSDIRYGIELIVLGSEGDYQGTQDIQTSPETIVLGPNEAVTKTITYTTRNVASGTYAVLIKAQTGGGLPLGSGFADLVTITTEPELSIDAESCFFTVSGREEEATHGLYQGLDVSVTEGLQLTCPLKNNSSESRTVIPRFSNFLRSVYGDSVIMSYPEEKPIELLPNSEREVSLIVPKATKPQAYELVVALFDPVTNNQVSNKIFANYVIQGVNAAIQNISLSNTEYKTGETIELTLFSSHHMYPISETPIAGEFQGVVTISDQDGAVCADPVKQVLTNNISKFAIVVTSPDCTTPSATVRLYGPDDQLLDSRTIILPIPLVVEKVEAVEDAETISSEKIRDNNFFYVFLFLLILTVLLIALFYYRKTHSKTE